MNEYPCEECMRCKPCRYMRCDPYRAWLSEVWHRLRQAAQALREQEGEEEGR